MVPHALIWQIPSGLHHLNQGSAAATKPQILTRLDALDFFLIDCYYWVSFRLPDDFLNCKRLIFPWLTGD